MLKTDNKTRALLRDPLSFDVKRCYSNNWDQKCCSLLHVCVCPFLFEEHRNLSIIVACMKTNSKSDGLTNKGGSRSKAPGLD